MNALAAFPSLAPALPEIILSLGAMVLLMFGAFNGEKATPAINLASVVLLIAAAVFV
jgi:NADH-quinone oxidoreductase subunit N